ncbi:hypothetical protein MSM1_19135 [Mycobacterium sp. SM1]|uniref:hypothetical protein n=1 Tax=Mycobacterium sp. SM1 TaxID=2816243 RepID=UPI001BCAF733|nr:hypothetical protein [Mycobacterium sp. SM1]MBS4730346.1 hypothetical protein [Mycobacterium sp. SM1]
MGKKAEAEYSVRLYDESPNGVANILATLLQQNLDAFPKRVKLARRMGRPVAVVSTDTGGVATIVFGGSEAVVHNGVVGRPGVTVKATVNQILDVSQLAMKAGGLLPVGFFTRRGMGVLGAILVHRLVVKGLLIHAVTALRFIALVSVAP